MIIPKRNTENLVDLYMHATGKTEIPPIFHEWCCYATIAAAVGNRVGFFLRPTAPIKPNLYTFLISDSGVGKGEALDFAAKFLTPEMNYFNGGLTKQCMFDMFQKAMKESDNELGIDYSNMYLHSPELADNVGDDHVSRMFVKAMTNWYTVRGPIVDGTRKHGLIVGPEPTINWAAGTTIEWLTDVVDIKAMRSGFFGRVVPVTSLPMPRLEEDWFPDDYDDCLVKIAQRFEDLSHVRGFFDIDADAKAFVGAWYMERPEPPQDLRAFSRRERVLVYKLAMILSLAENFSLTMRMHHVRKAVALVEKVRRMFLSIVGDATSTQQYQMQQRLLEMIRELEPIDATTLQRKLQRRMNGATINYLLEELLDLRQIEQEERNDHRRVYWYKGNGAVLDVKNATALDASGATD